MEHGVDPVLKLADAPAFELGNLDVEVAFESIIDVDQGFDVCPAQLSPQCRDNLFVGKCFGKVEAMTQLVCTPASAVGLGELLGEGGDDLFAVLGALTLKDFCVDAVTHLLVEQGDFGIDGDCRTVFGGID